MDGITAPLRVARKTVTKRNFPVGRNLDKISHLLGRTDEQQKKSTQSHVQWLRLVELIRDLERLRVEG